MKRLLMGCVTLLALGAIAAPPAFADQASDNANAAKHAASVAKADRDRAAHLAKTAAGHAKDAIDASASSRKTLIAHRADTRKHRLAMYERRHHRAISASEHAVSASASAHEKAVTDSAHAQKHALDMQHH